MNRLQITKHSDKEISIEISPLKDKASKQQIIFLFFGILGLIFAVVQLLSDIKPFVKIFLLVWSLIWIVLLIKIWIVFKWKWFGKEAIKISGKQITIIKTSPFTNKREEISIEDSIITKNDYQIPKNKEFFEVHPGSLIIENKKHSKSLAIGKYINDKDIHIIIKELQNYGVKGELINEEITENKATIIEEKYSKKHIRILRLKLFLICLVPTFLYGYSGFKKDTNKHNLLKAQGEIIEVHSEYIEHWDIDYYSFYFIASNGQKIESHGKCTDKERFDDFYKNLKVIYNPSKPEQYTEYPYFKDYSLKYKIFFFLILLPIIVSIMLSTLISIIYLAIKGQIKITPPA